MLSAQHVYVIFLKHFFLWQPYGEVLFSLSNTRLHTTQLQQCLWKLTLMIQYLFQAVLKYQATVNAFEPLLSVTFDSLLEHCVIIYIICCC